MSGQGQWLGKDEGGGLGLGALQGAGPDCRGHRCREFRRGGGEKGVCDRVAKCVQRVREGCLTPARGSRDRGTRPLGVGAGDTCLPGGFLSPGRSPEMQALLVVAGCTEVMVLPVSQGNR